MISPFSAFLDELFSEGLDIAETFEEVQYESLTENLQEIQEVKNTTFETFKKDKIKEAKKEVSQYLEEPVVTPINIWQPESAPLITQEFS